MSTKHATHIHQASRVAVRALILPTPRSCCLALSVTTPLYNTTGPQALRKALRSSNLWSNSPPPRFPAPRFVTPSVMAASAGVCRICYVLDSRIFNKRISRSTLLAASHRLRLHKWLVYSLRTADKAPDLNIGCSSFLQDLQEENRADERTRTADLRSHYECAVT